MNKTYITTYNLAKILKEFDIVSNTIRIGTDERAKGYIKDQFKDAFTRYLTIAPTASPITSVTTGQVKGDKGNSQNNKRDIRQMSRIEKPLQVQSNNGCHVVTDKIPLATGGHSEIAPKHPKTNINTHAINDLLDDDEGVYFDLD